jgi:hypothetical protein
VIDDIAQELDQDAAEAAHEERTEGGIRRRPGLSSTIRKTTGAPLGSEADDLGAGLGVVAREVELRPALGVNLEERLAAGDHVAHGAP